MKNLKVLAFLRLPLLLLISAGSIWRYLVCLVIVLLPTTRLIAYRTLRGQVVRSAYGLTPHSRKQMVLGNNNCLVSLLVSAQYT